MFTFALNTNDPCALVDDRLAFDVVLVADLADDLLEQILDRHQPGGAAVFVDDDRDLHLLALELLQHLRNALGFGHERRRPDQPLQIPIEPHRPGFGAGETNQVLHEHHAGDVVEILGVDGDAGILLLAKQRAEIVERGVGPNRHHVRPRRHHFADERVAEIDDRLEQLAPIALDQALVVDRVRLLRGNPRIGGSRGIVDRRIGALAPALRGDELHQRSGQRVEESGDDIERRQEHLEHALRIAAHDQQRQHVRTDEYEQGEEDKQQADRLAARRAR